MVMLLRHGVFWQPCGCFGAASGSTPSHKDWEAFEAWINRPAEAVPALAELASRTPSWER
jgi:hypothetical protein